jgi:hypothetical protein
MFRIGKFPEKNKPSTRRALRRRALAVSRRADDKLRAERARWAAGGFAGPPPEMTGTFGETIIIDTGDGGSVIFSAAIAAEAPEPATSESVGDARTLIRQRPRQTEGPPPENATAAHGRNPARRTAAKAAAGVGFHGSTPPEISGNRFPVKPAGEAELLAPGAGCSTRGRS